MTLLLVIIILLFTGGWIYLKLHKKQVISYFETEVKKGLNGGTIHLSDIHIGFSHTFPRFAFTIDSLSLRDSLWQQHHHDLLFTTRSYATLDFFKLITGKIRIGRIRLEKPKIYIYTDTTGYTNTSIFKKKEAPKKATPPKTPEYPILEIRDGSLIVDQQNKRKFFGYDIHRLSGEIHSHADDPNLQIEVDLDCRVQRMTFNPERGSYLEGKTVAGAFRIQFNTASKVLLFEKIHLAVDRQPFIFSGKFFLAEVPAPFMLSWETNKLPFRKAASFLSENIRSKLDPYDISQSITRLSGSIDNTEPEYKTPLIRLRLHVDNKTITTPVVGLDHASFTATFNNEEIKGRGHEDENTVMHFSTFNGTWNHINLRCDSIVIRNLIHPRINLHVLSDFRLENISNILDDNMVFDKGLGQINLLYSGSLESNYDSLRMVTGRFNLDSATIAYLPRNLLFTQGKGVIRFTGKDMLVDHLSLLSGSTDLVMDGAVKNLFYLISQKNKKLTLDWSIHSNKLNLNDFTSYLKKKQPKPVPVKKRSMLAHTLTDITSLLETADINLNLNAKQLIYKKFYADNLVANLEMDDYAINLKNIRLQASGGNLMMQGILRNEIAANPFSFKARLSNVNVSRLFSAFNNFGLKSPTDKNIAGGLTADITLNGGLTTKAEIIPDELKGFVKFNLEDGQLINFEPVQKIQQTVFKNRNFSDLQFADLHDLLEINGENITINRMEIRSSALHMFVEGMYNMKSGPDLSIQVPLSNLKETKDSVLRNKGIYSKTGVSARLRAQRGADGKIKITWDPFHKAGKEKKKQSAKPKA